MSGTLITPNMNLPNPIPAIETGPQWSYDIAACLTIIDSHNHSSGQGVQIQPNGLNINSDLPFLGNNATLLRATRFSPQASPIANSGADVGELYVSGNELYYNDVTGGNQVKITSNGSVNAGAGSITGLPSGTASATFSSGTFVWQSATNTAANMDAGSYVFRNSGANSYGLTLSAPTLGANSALVLPAIPSSQSFLTLDTSGNIAGYASINQGIQRTNLVAVGQQKSSSCGSFSAIGNSSPQEITNLNITITTTGRPVMLLLQDDGVAQSSFIQNENYAVTLSWLRGATILTGSPIFINTGAFSLALPPGVISYLDTPGAGTYTYSLQFSSIGGGELNMQNCVIVAYEL